MPEIFRPQNCGAVANTLHVTGRVENDPRLLRLYNRFCLQGDRSITTAERAADRKLARLNGTRRGQRRRSGCWNWPSSSVTSQEISRRKPILKNRTPFEIEQAVGGAGDRAAGLGPGAHLGGAKAP